MSYDANDPAFEAVSQVNRPDNMWNPSNVMNSARFNMPASSFSGYQEPPQIKRDIGNRPDNFKNWFSGGIQKPVQPNAMSGPALPPQQLNAVQPALQQAQVAPQPQSQPQFANGGFAASSYRGVGKDGSLSFSNI